jgi:4-diphosphocytidyl-2-C-methyl-D-erythritol kinase
MVIFPKSKINLGLRIIEKRPDGFHNIETVFYPVGLSDALEFVISTESLKDDKLIITGLKTDCRPEDNLVIKAVRRLRERNNIPILKIHLHKVIPMKAGLGGGSSDAASMLKILNRYFRLSIDDRELKEISLTLGSDCPFFIESLPVFAAGRGEIMTAVKPSLTGFYILLVNPGIGVSTKEAYRNCPPHVPAVSLPELFSLPVYEWKNLIKNDFEEYVFRVFPEIKKIKETLYGMGAIYSSMSGSGSTVYGIFGERPDVPDSIKDELIYSGIL